MVRNMKSLTKYLPLFLIGVASVAVWAAGLHQYLNFYTLRTYHQELQNFVMEHLILALFVFAILYIIIVGLSLPVATFMSLVGGLLFGQFLGTVTVVISATLGATVLFLAMRSASESFVEQKAGPWLQKMKKGFQEHGFYYLMTLRLIPFFPFVTVNLAAAFLQIPLRTFFWGTLIGIIPGSFVYVSIGNGLKDVIQEPNFSPKIILAPRIIIGFIGLGILSLLPVFYKSYLKKRSKK
jgi:uncharacterized membrane protein YdjX (TVP38/TMEM64 family)